MFISKYMICLLVIMATAVVGLELPGPPRPFTNWKKAEERLSHSLTKLAAEDGPDYKLSKFHYATTQKRSDGILNKFIADVVDTDGKKKNCKIAIWYPKLIANDVRVTFECDEEQTVVAHHKYENVVNF